MGIAKVVEVSDSGSIWTGEPDGFVDNQIQAGRVKVKSKTPLGFLTRTTGQKALSFAEMGKAEKAGLGEGARAVWDK